MKSRFLVALLVLFVPLGFCFIFDQEVWPYSHFPLFVRPPDPFHWVRIIGVRSDGSEELIKDESYARPFGLLRLAFTFDNLLREGRTQDAKKLMASLAERARVQQANPRPEAVIYKALRVYRIQYASDRRPYSDSYYKEKNLIAEEEL